MATPRTLGLLFAGLSCAPSAVHAQYLVSARAGMVQSAEGSVFVDSQPVHLAAAEFPMLRNGQVLRTERGLAEISLAPGVFLRLGGQSSVRLISSRLQDTQVELQRGTALVEVVNLTKGDRIRVQFGDTRTEFKRMGVYRFELDPRELRVFGGDAVVQSGEKRVDAGRGKTVHLSDPLTTSSFDINQRDALHRWAANRSFSLFTSSEEARRVHTHWETNAFGWSWNRDFGMRLYSPIVAQDYRDQQAREAKAQADEDDVKKQLRAVDRQQDLQQRQQQQQQKQSPNGPRPIRIPTGLSSPQ